MNEYFGNNIQENLQPYIVEFVGSLVILYILFYTRDSVNAPLYIGLITGATILLGDQFEQGHFNPLFSLLKYFDGRITLYDLLLFLLSQILACFVCFIIIMMQIYAKRILFIKFI